VCLEVREESCLQLDISPFLHPTTESQRLQQDLQKVEQLESKIGAELSSLKEKIQQITDALETYSDLDGLKAAGEEKKK
ncbi:hypothetical protein scyTo_0025960, partial [Scyliorhinus torazame]|nr:hypothetical protein [Scyliorhinus torazame]